MFHGNQSYVCRYCGLPLKLRESLKRHLSKKHQYLKDEWNSLEALESMLVVNNEHGKPFKSLSAIANWILGVFFNLPVEIPCFR